MHAHKHPHTCTYTHTLTVPGNPLLTMSAISAMVRTKMADIAQTFLAQRVRSIHMEKDTSLLENTWHTHTHINTHTHKHTCINTRGGTVH